jgi:Uncharacterized conserved protein
MIPGIEIREISRENGVPETTVEKDYALNWILVAISREIDDLMALKGGTAIRKTYIGDYRFSDDLDFTLLVNIDKNMLEKKVITAVKKSKAESGINFNENIRIEETPNKTYEMVTYFRMLRKMGSPLRIRLDITRSEDEKIILPLKRRSIIHPYSDRCRGKILGYSLEEILAEKLRSLFQRTRPRDLYDVWYLLKRIEVEKSLEILPEKFKLKGVSMDNLPMKRKDFEHAWESSLKHQLKNLPNFDDVFNDVNKTIEVAKLRFKKSF